MNEHGFVNALRRRLAPHVYWLKMQISYAKGVADVWLSGPERDLWLEAKYVSKPPPVLDLCDPKKKYALSYHQQEWLRARHAEGRNVAVVVGTDSGSVLLTGTEFVTAITREEFLAKSVNNKQLADQIKVFLGAPLQT